MKCNLEVKQQTKCDLVKRLCGDQVIAVASKQWNDHTSEMTIQQIVVSLPCMRYVIIF